MRVVRADDTDLRNAFTGSASSFKIKSTEHYNQLGYDNNTITGVTFAARNPGSWGNGIRVATIDGLADQVISGINMQVLVSNCRYNWYNHSWYGCYTNKYLSGTT